MSERWFDHRDNHEEHHAFVHFCGISRWIRPVLVLCPTPLRALIWGLVLGVAPLALMFGPGSAPVEGIGSGLNFAFFALGPLMLIPFIASGAALGTAGGAAVLWAGRGRARWVSWAAGVALVGLVAALTLLPIAQRETVQRQLAEDRDLRAEAIVRADFKGTLAGHQVAFPASPRLHLLLDCSQMVRAGFGSCSTNFTKPVDILTGPDTVLLHEHKDPVSFLIISISMLDPPDCRMRDYCLTQEKIDRWCDEIRPDQANSIWCSDTPPMRFSLRTDAKATIGPSDRDEPELAAHYAETPLGPGRVSCFYAPDPDDTDRQGVSCRLTFDLVDGVKALMVARRAQITSNDPVLTATISLIPDYWAVLTGGQ